MQDVAGPGGTRISAAQRRPRSGQEPPASEEADQRPDRVAAAYSRRRADTATQRAAPARPAASGGPSTLAARSGLRCLVLLLTDWPEFSAIDPVALARLVRVPRI